MDFSGYSDKIKTYPIFGLSFEKSKSIHYARKAESLNAHLCQFDKPLVLLDIDCLIVRDLDDIFKEDFDIGITVDKRKKETKQINNVSSGVLFLKPSKESCNFIENWVAWQRLSQDKSRDQISLSRLIISETKNNNIKIKRFDENLYNSYPQTNSVNDIKQWKKKMYYTVYIKHFAHGLGIEEIYYEH